MRLWYGAWGEREGLTSQLPAIDGRIALGFLDLIEVRVIDAIRQQGVGWPTIRRVRQHASDILRTPHPFANRRLRTDGRTIFADVADETGEATLVDLARRQYAIKEVLGPVLKDVEFDLENEAARWWPSGKRAGILIDPALSFGQPIMASSRVPTVTLTNALKVEKSIEAVAAIYQVSVASVRAAVGFEAGGRMAA